MARRYWFRARRFLAQKVLHTDDTPHAVALGAGIAMVVAFLPLVGLQTVIAVGLAALFRANKAICLPIVWITNPFTLVPIYGACWRLGRLVLPYNPQADQAAVLSGFQSPEAAGLFEVEFWKGLLHTLASLGLELWVGCAIVGIFFAIVCYFLVRWSVDRYRERRRHKLLRRAQFRSKQKPGKVTRHREPA